MNPVPSPCVCASLRKVTRAVTQLYDDALRPSGLRAMQFNILMTIRGMGEPSLSDLANYLWLDQTTLTRSLTILERAGWIARVSREDRRLRSFKLSSKGKLALKRAEPRWLAVQQKVLDKIGESAWQASIQSLTELAKLAGTLKRESRD